MDVDKKMKTKKKRKRTVISPHEMDILETSFRLQPRPDRDAKLRLARQLNKTDNFISIWFQNRRARERKCLSQPHAAFGIRSFSQSSMSEFSPAGGDRHGLGRFVYDQEEPLDLSDRASNQFGVGQSHGPVSPSTGQLLFGRIIRMAAAVEGGILPPHSPYTAEAITDSCQGIRLNDGLLVYTKDLGFDVQDVE